MAFNLLVEKWIPVIRRSGQSDWIAPWQIAERDDPPLRIASPRPDFDSGLMQFLIGLLQTAFMPEDELEWREALKDSQIIEQLREALKEHEPYFNLDGDGVRFMQDPELASYSLDDAKPVSSLLMDSPGDQTLRHNKDFFIKRGQVDGLEPAMVAAALYTLQCNAPSGGRGYRTSLRGGGPLTTLVESSSSTATLWSDLWLNVLPQNAWDSIPGDHEVNELSRIYPWMRETRSSEKKGSGTTPTHVSPLEHYWGTPRRIFLRFEELDSAKCSLSQRQTARVCQSLQVQAYGNNYEGAFQHPLSPHLLLKPKDSETLLPNPKKLGSDGLLYRDWPLIALGGSVELPAVVVRYAIDHRSKLGLSLRIWATGFSMDNMKAEAFFSARQPLFEVPLHLKSEISNLASSLVAAADYARRTLLDAMKLAFKRNAASRKSLTSNKGVLDTVSRSLWFETNQAFFSHLEEALGIYLGASPNPNESDSPLNDPDANDSETNDIDIELRESWLSELHQAALSLFHRYSQESGGMLGSDPKQLAEGFRLVSRATHPNASKFRSQLGLAPVTRRKAS